MDTLQQMTGVWLYGGCFLLSVVSALFPWVIAEVVVLSASALVRTPVALVLVVLVGTAGQVAGKSVLYWAGRGTLHLRLGNVTRAVESLHSRLKQHRWGSHTVIFVSAAFAVPPFYLTTVAAGALKIPFVPFAVLCAAGCAVRFALLVFTPRLLIGLFRQGRP